MKKFLSIISIVLCTMLCAMCLTACGSATKYLRQTFVFEGDELTIEHVDNAEKDFVYPISGLKLDHSKYDERILEHGWVIYNKAREIVGWIESDGGYDFNKNGSYIYGYPTSVNNGVYGYSDAHLCVVLKTTDLSIYDRIEVKSDHGSIEFDSFMDENPYNATKRYADYNQQTGETKPWAGAENFVCGHYTLKISDLDPDTVKTITVTFSLKAE